MSSYTYPWAVGVAKSMPQQPLTAMGLVAIAAELGVPVVQIADNLPLHALDVEALDALDEAARVASVSIEVGTRGIGADNILRYLALATRLGSGLLRVVLGGPDGEPTPTEAYKFLLPHRARFVDAGLTLAIENHDHHPSADLAALVCRLGEDWVGICLDTVNSFGALEGPEQVVANLSPYVVNVHVKDFVVRRSNHNMGFVIEGAPVGDGQLDVPWLLRQLEGRTFSSIIEMWMPPEATVAATVAKQREWAERSVHYLRKLDGELR